MCSWETRPPQSGEYDGAGGDDYQPALLTELPVTLASQPAHFSQDTTQIPADLNKIKTFQKPGCVTTSSRIVFTFCFQTTLGAKRRLMDLFRRPLDNLRAKSSFCVHPFPRHLLSCEDHHYTARFSATAFLHLSFVGGNTVWGFSTSHATRTGGAEVDRELWSPNLWPSLSGIC